MMSRAVRLSSVWLSPSQYSLRGYGIFHLNHSEKDFPLAFHGDYATLACFL